jgi:hypothetical protein
VARELEAWPIASFPHPRSSNRTCGSPASGFRTRTSFVHFQEVAWWRRMIQGRNFSLIRSRLGLRLLPRQSSSKRAWSNKILTPGIAFAPCHLTPRSYSKMRARVRSIRRALALSRPADGAILGCSTFEDWKFTKQCDKTLGERLRFWLLHRGAIIFRICTIGRIIGNSGPRATCHSTLTPLPSWRRLSHPSPAERRLCPRP